MLEIDKGIPVPERSKTKGFKYPWTQLEVGDSFLVPCADEITTEKTYRRMSAAYGYYKPKRYLARRVEGGVRVWRTE